MKAGESKRRKKEEDKMATAELAAVSVRADISTELAQQVLSHVKRIPKAGVWAEKVIIRSKTYVVGQPRLRSIVVVLPLPYNGDHENYRILKPFVSLEGFIAPLERD
jgi:hypothetical protein